MNDERAETRIHYRMRDLIFEPWTPWHGRRDLRKRTPEGGVYLLAYFSVPPPPTPPVPERLPYDVIYVGDAKDLNARPLTEPHHKVGPGLLDALGADALDFLHVAVGPLYVVDPDARRYAYQRTYSTYLENKLAWDYAKIHGHPPILQVKTSALNHEWIRGVISKLKGGDRPLGRAQSQ